MTDKMSIVWITNKVIPAVEMQRTGRGDLVKEGWLSTMFDQLCGEDNVTMTIVCFGASADDHGSAEGFEWYTIAENRADENGLNPEQIRKLHTIFEAKKPHVIHVWGSEYPHSLAAVKAAEELRMADRVVISLQGVISEYAKVFEAGLSERIVHARTFFDLVRRTNIADRKKDFEKRGECEILAIRGAGHVIGRTFWDRACAEAIDPAVQYHHCNETLRGDFYEGVWSEEKCVKHRIFISQADYPIKGFHLFLDVLPALADKYPDITVHLCGNDPTVRATLVDKLKESSYGRYLRQRIRREKLDRYITFLGRKSVTEMKREYLEANVFLSCSRIENSSNSVGEAMILGVPVVSSEVGGTATILKPGAEGITYDWQDREAMCKGICDVFEKRLPIADMCAQARAHALQTHDPANNYATLLNIYESIAEGASD